MNKDIHKNIRRTFFCPKHSIDMIYEIILLYLVFKCNSELTQCITIWYKTPTTITILLDN